jgi:translation initiation factor 1
MAVVRIRLEKKGRGGKWVTVIEGIPEHPDRLKVLSKQLKQQCGVGGGVKGLNLEIQGISAFSASKSCKR